MDKQCRPRIIEEAVLSGSSLFAFLTSILWVPVLIRDILFEILEHPKYMFKLMGKKVITILC